MEKLQPASLNWALTHISKFGDTDLFPVPFEYDAISRHWNAIKDHLADIDVEVYESRPLRRFLVPKPQGGYRVAIQLDPIDTILYTALVYEAADLIEKYRIPVESQVSCSYRVQKMQMVSCLTLTRGGMTFMKNRKLLWNREPILMS